MFTVLIMNKKTMDSFYNHLPLFNGFLQDDDTRKLFAVCEWNEQGQTIEEALPDLHELTDDKSAWRALIVRYEDGPDLKVHPFRPENPYDFLENEADDPNPEILESNPLIRLTRLLERPLEYFDSARAQREVRPALPKYNGILPDTMTLITLRHTDDLLSVPESIRVLDHPDFAHANGYPSLCRFALVDQSEQGPVRRRRDDFLFWNLVLMLAVNPMDSSLMQAYRLYVLSCEIDPARLEELWADKRTELARARRRIVHFLNHQSVYLEKYEGKYPEYTVSPEGFSFPASASDSIISSRDYEPVPEDPEIEYSAWKMKSAGLIHNLVESWSSVPDEIQKRTPAFSNRSGYKKENVDVLSPLQREKLNLELAELRNRINQEFRGLPGRVLTNTSDLEEQKRSMGAVLAGRPQRGRLLLWTFGFMGVCLVCVIPAWAAFAHVFHRSLGMLVTITCLMILLPLWFYLAARRNSKQKIEEETAKWNSRISRHYDDLNAYLKKYAQYQADLLSYRNGTSYLELSKDVSQDLRDHQRRLEQTLSELETYDRILERWGRAFGLAWKDVPLENESREAVDVKNLDVQDGLFTFERQSGHTCLVSETGRRAAAPFSFIERINVDPVSERSRES